MALDQHKSKLIPVIEYNLDGKLLVTNNDGTFPLRVKQGQNLQAALSKYEEQSFRSFDPRKAQAKADAKRRYIKSSEYQAEPGKFSEEVKNLGSPGTWNSKSNNTLGRRLRSQKYREKHDPKYGGMDSIRRKKEEFLEKKIIERDERKPLAEHLMNYPGSVSRGNAYKANLDLEALRRARIKQSSLVGVNGTPKVPVITIRESLNAKKKVLSDEHLPGIMFLVCGILLVVLGIINLVLSRWHEFLGALWIGAFVLVLGILGVTHRRDYLTKWKNGLYVLFGFLTAILAKVGVALCLLVLVPLISGIANKMESSDIINNVPFSRVGSNSSLVGVTLDSQGMVWATLGLGLAILLLFLVSFYAMTAAMICLGNHWDAVYETTALCDHRGNPRYFNPMEQISLGQAVILCGILVVVISNGLQGDHFFAPIWSGPLVCIGGIVSTCFAKKPERSTVGLLAVVIETVALVACSIAAVSIALTMVTQIDWINTVDPTTMKLGEKDLYIASIVFEVIYLLLVVINVIFCVGTLFRQTRRLCKCCTDLDNNNMESKG